MFFPRQRYRLGPATRLAAPSLFSTRRPSQCCAAILLLAVMLLGEAATAAPPSVDLVFPSGCRRGDEVTVTVSGANLTPGTRLSLSTPGATAESLGGNKFKVKLPGDATPGLYDLRLVNEHGVSGPRTFFVGTRREIVESPPVDKAKTNAAAKPEAGAKPAAEAKTGDNAKTADDLELLSADCTINGRLEKSSEIDSYRFSAKREQVVVVECWAERIDSRLRGVLEIYDAAGRRLAVDRGFHSPDPMIVFRAPSDGEYVVKLQDLTLGGGAEYYYRLDIDSGPRVAFVSPCVVQRGQPARLTVHGWNLGAAATPNESASDGLQTLEINLSASDTAPRASLPVRLRGYQSVVDWTMVETSGGALPALVSVTDAPVVVEARDAGIRKDVNNHTPASSQLLTAPVEVAGDFVRPDEVDWYSIDAAAGEVFYFEAFGQRIGSQVDLQIDVHEFRAAAGEMRTKSDETVGSPTPPESTASRAPNTSRIQRLASFEDETDNHGGRTVPTDHLDPSGRWVAPQAGRFLISVQNLRLGASSGPRRPYRFAVRREEPDFRVLAMPRSEEVRGLNVARGGRETIELVALRRRGMDGPICVRAGDLPFGLTCPDVWFGPGVNQATLVVSADRSVSVAQLSDQPAASQNSTIRPNNDGTFSLSLTAYSAAELAAIGGPTERDGRDQKDANTEKSRNSQKNDSREAFESGKAGRSSERTFGRPVASGVSIRTGTPNGWGRLTADLPLAVVGDAPLRITADAHQPVQHQLYGTLTIRHAPGGVVDVAVQVERRDAGHVAPVRLTAIGLPPAIPNASAVIPAGESSGFVSFALPRTLPLGKYSFAIAAETTVLGAGGKPEPATTVSNPVTIEVQPPVFELSIDPFAPTRAKRGEVIQIKYSARRVKGFIGKIHTELAAPGKVTDVVGLRGRGETFVGQTDKGSLQIIVNDDAPLGRQPFLRLLSVGVVEDQPIYHGASFVELEIVE